MWLAMRRGCARCCSPGQATMVIGSTYPCTIALPRAHTGNAAFAAPDLSGQSVLIAAPGTIEAPLVARRLERWGAQVCLAADQNAARATLGRHWDTLVV